MSKVKSNKINYAIPGDALSQQEFEEMIKKAEKGPFYSIDTLKANLAKWKAKILEVVISDLAMLSLEQIYEYGAETFSVTAATFFIEEIIVRMEQLSSNYLIHPECRYLVTKSKMYRNIIHGSYIVIYRILPDRIEVLNVLHNSRSISAIKSARKIKIE